MKKTKIKKIGILTSGGDGPGMNAAVRSVVRSALHYGLKVNGIMKGYEGLIDDETIELNHRSVSNIINRGGTILKTARSKRFMTVEGQKKALRTLKKHRIDGLVVVGGDGSYRGANILYKTWGFPTVGLPGTIDNDLCGTDQTIGCHTAVDTALGAIDKIRDTAQSMERIFVIEVMGRNSGYIAMQVALGAGAEDVVIPEHKFDYQQMYKDMVAGNKKGKISWIVVVAEGAGKANEIAEKITKSTGLETRFVVLGHVQRGGTPTALDRIFATRTGAAAVELLLKGIYGKAVGIVEEKINIVDLSHACSQKKLPVEEYYRLMKILT
ncbi:MAG TPA: 6-phosphofructokinase [Candidatus Omnitrophota bacterium]|nr:6-phosphofructokinase [Candidatus Omnitrophota bacterium]HPD84963.1 6-phosphofructokinase [Candidatus Omnitrophota bacterium]HRZ03821.1 6-phosphofructokinase [Candidatus Omnitrophota bacterium]